MGAPRLRAQFPNTLRDPSGASKLAAALPSPNKSPPTAVTAMTPASPARRIDGQSAGPSSRALMLGWTEADGRSQPRDEIRHCFALCDQLLGFELSPGAF